MNKEQLWREILRQSPQILEAGIPVTKTRKFFDLVWSQAKAEAEAENLMRQASRTMDEASKTMDAAGRYRSELHQGKGSPFGSTFRDLFGGLGL